MQFLLLQNRMLFLIKMCPESCKNASRWVRNEENMVNGVNMVNMMNEVVSELECHPQNVVEVCHETRCAITFKIK